MVTLFLHNAFQIIYFLWIWYVNLNSCFHENNPFLIVKLSIGVGVLLLCSYITLPLYALIAQMGSHMKKSIFDEQTSKALKNWHMAVKEKKGGRAGRSPTRTLGDASPTLSTASNSMSSTLQSSAAALHRFKTTGHSTLPHDYHDMSDTEADPSTTESTTAKLIVRVDYGDTGIETTAPHPGGEQLQNEDDFSFGKPAPLQ